MAEDEREDLTDEEREMLADPVARLEWSHREAAACGDIREQALKRGREQSARRRDEWRRRGLLP